MNEDNSPIDPNETPMPDFGPGSFSSDPAPGPIAPEPLPLLPVDPPEEPTYAEPVYEEPAYHEPVHEEPAYEEPAHQEPTHAYEGEDGAIEVAPVPPPIAPSLIDTSRPSAFSDTTETLNRIRSAVSSVFLGQDEVVDQILIALLANGHVLLEGKPGLGKTHLVLALSRTFGGSFSRIQFTPDLMPSDVTGHTLFDMGSQTFRVRKGPVFANLLLADEINRAPAKTQSSLLEVMQERQVTIDGDSMKLPPPFLVFATQNPIEQEGTYPLPEAQLDRFLLKVLIDYPEHPELETAIVRGVTAGTAGGTLNTNQIEAICTPEDILQAQADCAAVQAVDEVIGYAVNIARATREAQGIALGAGTRGAISMVQAAKARALIEGRDFIIPDDIKSGAVPALRHRLTLAPELAISGETVDRMIGRIVETVEAPRT